MPNRNKKTKPLNRSVSDASQKKQKKPSIFNLFSKRSDPNLIDATGANENGSGTSGMNGHQHHHQQQYQPNSAADIGVAGNNTGTSPGKHNGVGKPVKRSKSDVGYNSNNGATDSKTLIIDRKRINSTENDGATKSKKKSQLSPIIENPPQEIFFGCSSDERGLQRASKSEDRTLLQPSETFNRSMGVLNGTRDDIDFPKKPRSNTPHRSGTGQESKSLESLHLHSSQLPQKKLPLTKGLTVDGMVKRLSMERFSPPPQINSPGFSYIRPNEPIVYAQVVRDAGSGDTKQTIHSSFDQTPLGTVTPSKTGKKYLTADTVDFVDTRKQGIQRQSVSPNHQDEFHHFHSKNKDNIERFGDPVVNVESLYHRNYSDEDEGLGLEPRKPFGNDDDLVPTRDVRLGSAEPPIIPRFQPSYGDPDRSEHLIELSNRRRMLESKIHSRSFGAPDVSGHHHQQRFDSPNRNNHVPYEQQSYRTLNYSPERQPSLSPPRKQWAQQKPYRPDGVPRHSNETTFLNSSDGQFHERSQKRDRDHITTHKVYMDGDIDELPVKSTTPNRVIDLGYIDNYNNEYNGKHRTHSSYQTHETRTQPHRSYYGDHIPEKSENKFSTLERDKHKYRSFDKGDSGIENDFKRDRESNRDSSISR